MKLATLMVGVTLTLAACATEKGVMRVDGSSQETTNSSLKQMAESLSAQNRCRLQAAILRIQIGDASTWKAGNTESKEKPDPLGTMLNNMSFQQVLDLSQRYHDKAGNPCKK